MIFPGNSPANSQVNSSETVQPDLFEEKECDELPENTEIDTEIEIIDEQACIHGKSIQDYCPHCTEDKFEEVFRNWEEEIDGRNEK